MTPRSLPLAATLAAALLVSPLLRAQSTDTVLTPRTFIDIARAVLPAVVSIEVTVPISDRLQKDYGVQNMEEFMRRLMEDRDALRNFPFPQYNDQDFGYRGSGSGVVVGLKEGWAYVVTNRHVVGTNDRTTYAITLDSSYGDSPVRIAGSDVEWVGDDALSDIAVLRFRIPDNLEVATVEFADSDAVEVGEWVVALGNPLDLGNSVSQGIVSAMNRSVGAFSRGPDMSNRFDNHIQTTAVINPGNSGGPLVNLDGRIVGINNAIATETGRWAGIGFAIPGNIASKVADQLIAGGRVSRGYLGIAMRDVTDVRSTAYPRKLKEGVSIEDVRPDTPAQSAGLTRGDIVVAVDSRRVRNSQELLESIATRTAGDTVRLKVRRFDDAAAANDLELDIRLIERPSEAILAEAAVPVPTLPDFHSRFRRSQPSQAPATLGLALAPAEIEGVKGLLVQDVQNGTPADRAGLRPGDLLLQVNGLPTTTEDELFRALANAEPASDHVLVFRRDGEKRTATVEQAKP